MGTGHDHGTATGAHRSRLAIVLGITDTVLVVEVIGGLVSGSLALLADAGHMATDAAGIALALVAATLAQRPVTAARTFGLQRVEILAAAANAVVLFALGAYILVEAARRLSDPPEIGSGLMLAVALVGLVANALSLGLLHQGRASPSTCAGPIWRCSGTCSARSPS